MAANTCKSGSATVTAKPKIKATGKISPKRRVLVSAVPTFVPMGTIEISAPREKSPIPNITNTVPIKKLSIISVPTGKTQKQSKTTIRTMGNTLRAASLIFSVMAVLSLKIAALLIIHPIPNLICLAPIQHMLCFLAAAHTFSVNMLLLKRNTA